MIEYFSHDYDAQSDPKLARLRMAHRSAGYGIFWLIVERLYRFGGKIPDDIQVLAFELQEPVDIVRSVLTDFDLFTIEDGFITSASVTRRLEIREEAYRKKAEAGRSGGLAKSSNARAVLEQSLANSTKEKGKEKEKEQIKDLTNVAPSPSDSPPPSPAVLTFACIKDREWVLTEAKLAEYATTYPAVDVKAECRKAWQWIADRPANRKTVGGMPAFLSRWLGKAQNNGGPNGSGTFPNAGAKRVVGDAAPVAGKYSGL